MIRANTILGEPWSSGGSPGLTRDVKPLLRVPPMEQFESPASWLSRVALSQGVSVRTMKVYLQIPQKCDVDLEFESLDIKAIAARCGLALETFAFCRHMLASLKLVDPLGERFLTPGEKVSAYRYCPVCLRNQRVTSFPLHWRFDDWLFCPLHDCLMERACRQCGHDVKLPMDLIAADLPMMQVCSNCNHSLHAHWKRVKGSLKKMHLSTVERWILEHGRAVLAALFYRQVWIKGAGGVVQMPFHCLKNLSETGLLKIANPNREFILKLRELRKRIDLEKLPPRSGVSLRYSSIDRKSPNIYCHLPR